MAKDKKSKVQEAKETVDKKQKEANIENDITKLPNGKGSKSTGSGTTTSSTKATGGFIPSGTKPSGSSTPTVSPEQQAVVDAIGSFEKELEAERKDTEAYNQQKAEEKGFDTKKGRSEAYQSLSTVKKEKDRAKENLDKVISENETISKNKAIGDTYKNALKANKKAKKEANKIYDNHSKDLSAQEKELEGKTKGLDRTNVEGELAETNGELETYLKMAKEDLSKNVEGFNDSEWLARFDDLSKRETELTEKRDVLLQQLKDLDSLDKIKGELADWKEQQKAFTADNLNVLMEWANTTGTDDDKARASTIKSLMDVISKADEDGVITDEELDGIEKIGNECDRLIKEEMENNPEIRAAQDAYDSADAKFSYFLFDQIKSIAVLLVGLSVGNAQMVYSALDNFNKQIADAEAGYNTDTIKAFSNNNVKNITGQSDAEYIVTTEILPELKKQKAFQDLSEREKEVSVRALEKAFEEYRRYATKGGGDDFRAWFTAQTANGNGSGWASVITTLIQAGALNWDAIIKAFGSGSQQPKPKGGPVSFNLGTQGATNELMASILKNQSDEITSKQSTPQVTRDKQNTVVNSLASKIPQQPSAPQNGPVQARSNSRWNAIG